MFPIYSNTIGNELIVSFNLLFYTQPVELFDIRPRVQQYACMMQKDQSPEPIKMPFTCGLVGSKEPLLDGGLNLHEKRQFWGTFVGMPRRARGRYIQHTERYSQDSSSSDAVSRCHNCSNWWILLLFLPQVVKIPGLKTTKN